MFARTVAIALALLRLVPVVLADTGPFTGTVRENQQRSHKYDNNPDNDPCIQVMATYTVTLTYAPTSDVLTLSVGDQSVTGSGGTATLTFQAPHCTAFTIRVTGTDVQSVASYTVTVERGSGGTVIA